MMKNLEKTSGILSSDEYKLLKSLIAYWKHQYELLQGFERNKQKLQENNKIINSWILDIENCINNKDN